MEGRWREKREDADKAAVNRRRDVSAPLPSLFRDSRDFPTTNDKFIPEAMDELASFPLVKRYYRVSFAGESEEGSRKLFDRRPLIRHGLNAPYGIRRLCFCLLGRRLNGSPRSKRGEFSRWKSNRACGPRFQGCCFIISRSSFITRELIARWREYE